MDSAKTETEEIQFRSPILADGAGMYELAQRCEPLDVNSLYAYLLVPAHFAETSVAARRGEELVGFISGYLKPADPQVLFVWQVAVSPTARGEGLASRMLDELVQRKGDNKVRWVETTITPSNRASWALFESFAKRHGAQCADETFFRAEDFGNESHEEERLLRIGPFK